MHLAVQAIIMAGGEGVRLRPLTMHMPKPLVPLLGEPVMGYALKLLRTHGITDVGATLWYQPRKIRAAFGKGEKWGVHLRYYEENVPMGTAGSMRMARDHLTGTFLVLSGDGLTDCDLTRALAFHREKKALATLVLRRVSVPLPYGVVLTDKDSRITRFIEKPTWSRVFSDLVNTGIYILEPEIFEYIPDRGMPDFGKDIFPALLSANLPLYGFETTGYWCDVGDQGAYLAAQHALLRGEVALPHPGGIDESARIDPTARIEGSCWIGPEAEIGPGALIRDAMVGEKCVIAAGAAVENSCLWPRAAVQEKARVSGSVLCDGAVARQGAEIPDGCALGQGASAGAFSQLRPGVRVWPHRKVAPGAVVSAPVISGDFSLPQWTGRGADCDSPERVCALCAACVKVTGARRMIAAHQGADAILSLAAGALAASGVRVLSAGSMTQPMLCALIQALGMEGGVFVSGQTIRFFGAQGEVISSRQMAAMDQCVLRQEGPPPFSRPGSVIRFTGGEEIYLAHILPEAENRPLWSPIAVFSDSGQLKHLAAEGLARMDARDVRCAALEDAQLRPGETGFLLPENGEDVTVFTREMTLSPEQKTMLLLALCHDRQGKLFDLEGVPRAAEGIAPLRSADGSRECLRQRTVLRDGLAAVFALCRELKRGTLPVLLSGIPETHIVTRDVTCEAKDKGRILHTLCDFTSLPHTLGEGVRIQHEKGFATIVPDAHRGLVRVMSESKDSEFARELCDFYQDQIQRMTDRHASFSNAP